MSKITMKELAEKAQDSTTSMKRYLKNQKVGKEIADKIKSAIDKTGDVVEETKKKMKKTKEDHNKKEVIEEPIVDKHRTSIRKMSKKQATPTIKKGEKQYSFAILTKDVTNPRSRKIMKALQSVIHECDCTFMVCVGEGNAVLEQTYADAFVQQQVHAVVVESCANPSGIATTLEKAGIACVFLNNHTEGITNLAVDEQKASEILGNYMMDMHHLIVRYIGADEALATAHYEGIKHVYHEKRQPLDYAIKMCDGSHIDTYEKIKEIFEEKIDLLLLERDEMAIPLNKYLKEYHIAVPQNMSVISYGGHAITNVMSPTLTSLAFDYNRYAIYILETIFAILEGGKKPRMPKIYHIQEGDSVR